MDRPWGRPYTRKLAAFLAQLACGMVTLQRALTGVLEPKMDQTGRQGLHGIAKLLVLISWVGSPDLGIVHLFPPGCSAPRGVV